MSNRAVENIPIRDRCASVEALSVVTFEKGGFSIRRVCQSARKPKNIEYAYRPLVIGNGLDIFGVRLR